MCEHESRSTTHEHVKLATLSFIHVFVVYPKCVKIKTTHKNKLLTMSSFTYNYFFASSSGNKIITDGQIREIRAGLSKPSMVACLVSCKNKLYKRPRPMSIPSSPG